MQKDFFFLSDCLQLNSVIIAIISDRKSIGEMVYIKRVLFPINSVKRILLLVTICLSLWLYIWYLYSDDRIVRNLNLTLDCDSWQPDVHNNITGWPTNIVPNIVHYILFEQRKISYSHMLSMLSVIRIHKPEHIYIHCDCEHFDSDDKNWERILRAVNETNTISIHLIPTVKPTEINGHKIRKEYANYHASDITRYRLMKEYGGIYLDNDILVCQPLHHFRKFEFTLNWDEGLAMGSQVLIGHKDARVMKLILKTYEAYDTNRWYFNAGQLPTMAVLEKFPFLVHRVKRKFGVDAPNVCPYFYNELHSDWTNDYYTFHMCMRGDQISHKEWCLGDNYHPLKAVVFDDNLIKSLNNTFGVIARQVLFPARP